MLELTKRDIQQDIEAFEGRIQIAMDKLSVLPSTASTPKERRGIRDRRRALLQEIEHVRALIALASEALGGI